MIHQYIGIFIFLLIMIPVCAVVIPILLVLAFLHPWIALMIIGVIFAGCFISDEIALHR